MSIIQTIIINNYEGGTSLDSLAEIIQASGINITVNSQIEYSVSVDNTLEITVVNKIGE